METTVVMGATHSTRRSLSAHPRKRKVFFFLMRRFGAATRNPSVDHLRRFLSPFRDQTTFDPILTR